MSARPLLALLLPMLLLLVLPAGAEPPEAGPLRTDPAAAFHGPAAAAGALVWLHPHYTEGEPPAVPAFTARLADAGWDVWRLDRTDGRDPIVPGAANLAAGTAALRALGYRQVTVVGESRGAFLMLAALRTPNLADAFLALAPAAHGRRADRRAEALADFRAALAAAAPDAVRRAGLVLFEGDPYDPDPAARAGAFRAAMQARDIAVLLIDRPADPTGHGGTNDPGFDARFGACLARFLDTARPAPADCAGIGGTTP